MFWGLIMESNKRYSQTVKRAFHISMAALDATTSSDDSVQVMCMFENKKYLMCTLQKDILNQTPLDLNFDVGDVISFVTNGKANVHLTGYLVEDPMDDIDEESDDEDVEMEEKIEKLGKINAKNIVSTKRPILPVTNKKDGPPTKITKTLQLLQEVNSQDEDDSDDSSVNFSDVTGDDDSLLMDEEDVDEDDAEEDQDDSEDDDDALHDLATDEDDSDAEDVEEEKEVKKPKTNGVAKSKVKSTPQKKEEKTPKAEKKAAQSPKSVGKKKIMEGGVTVEELVIGDGSLAKPGKVIQVYYEGRLKSNNKLFDSSMKGPGFKFRLGKHEVIKGWDVGVTGMKVGGKRRITCPPNMAYGHKGSPPVIPPNSSLIFEVELKNVM